MLLLNPGPVTLTPRVRASLTRPDLCHRESEFFDLQDEARERLLKVHALDPREWTAVLVTGSGTAAVEAMITTLVPGEGRLLVLENGVYGERIAKIAAIHGIAHTVLATDWMSPIDHDEVRAALDADAAITHVAVIHHETTTGRLNDLRALDDLCRARGRRLLVDGVSSFGAERIDFDAGAIDAVAAAANKCLHGAPGASFVIARRSALLRADRRRSLYLDLKNAEEQQSKRGTAFTPAVHVFHALVEALREFHDEGGLQARHARYAGHAERVRAGFGALRIAEVLPAAESSVVLRSYALPPSLGYAKLHDGLKARGFVIYAGQGVLAGTLFRISTMGDLQPDDIDRLVSDVGALLGSG